MKVNNTWHLHTKVYLSPLEDSGQGILLHLLIRDPDLLYIVILSYQIYHGTMVEGKEQMINILSLFLTRSEPHGFTHRLNYSHVLDLNKKRVVESPLWNSPIDCLLKELIGRAIPSVDPGAGLGNKRLP